MISADILRSYFERRLGALRSLDCHGGNVACESLLREDLRFIERVLSRALGPHHFELSIFTGGELPDIVSYYDSAGHDHPRSRTERAAVPTYYRDKGYAVVELLDGSDEPLKIVAQTRSERYNYTGPEQTSAIGSSILYRFLDEPPAALVITCDKQDAFSSGNRDIAIFVRSAGLAFQCEMFCSGLTTRARPAGGVPRTSIVTPEVTWLHVSDLHFGAPPATHRFDQRRVLDALLRDARALGSVDYIFVTGDIAYSGVAAEYESAAAWLEALADVVRTPVQRVRFVPGNHDVHRPTVKTHAMVRNAHETLRADPSKLDEYLSDAESQALLARKLAAYRETLGRRCEWHPALTSGDFDWVERLETPNYNVQLVGLSTVWVSDEHDGGSTPETSLQANMLLSGAQLATTVDRIEGADFVIVLTHHPTSWLASGCRSLFSAQVARHCHIHLCGHVHEAEGSLIRRLGDTAGSVAYVAGAAHGAPTDRHGYSWGALVRDEREPTWRLGWAPRVYVKDRNEFRAESTRFDLDERQTNWTELKA